MERRVLKVEKEMRSWGIKRNDRLWKWNKKKNVMRRGTAEREEGREGEGRSEVRGSQDRVMSRELTRLSVMAGVTPGGRTVCLPLAAPPPRELLAMDPSSRCHSLCRCKLITATTKLPSCCHAMQPWSHYAYRHYYNSSSTHVFDWGPSAKSKNNPPPHIKCTSE